MSILCCDQQGVQLLLLINSASEIIHITLKSTRRQFIIIILKQSGSRDETSTVILSLYVRFTYTGRKEKNLLPRLQCLPFHLVYIFVYNRKLEFWWLQNKVCDLKTSSLSSNILCVRKKWSVMERSLQKENHPDCPIVRFKKKNPSKTSVMRTNPSH